MTTTGRVFLTSIRSAGTITLADDLSTDRSETPVNTPPPKQKTYDHTLKGPEYDSEEYDTDLEEDFTPGKIIYFVSSKLYYTIFKN